MDLTHEQRAYRHRWRVLDVALELHMAATGAGEPVPDAAIKIEWLRSRLAEWLPGLVSSTAFDVAVRQVLVTTLLEYLAHHKAQT